MSYSVKEIFHTLQGEGAQAGRAAVFCRFAGCNLWSGREQDRATAVCRFCDTDFRGTNGEGGGVFADPETLAERIRATWSEHAGSGGRPFVVLTGGEPLLQLDLALIEALHAQGFEIALETNGTLSVPAGVDWICVSPKAGADLVRQSGAELKLVFPQPGLSPEDLEHLAFKHFFLQPMDGPHLQEHTRQAIAYCQTRPRWRLSIQTHKLLGFP
ncbi:7-carboxy-7-deazaguanine synthase [Thiocapsa roseopersicina]|uniref:7-carboxy-7-deazaguanine synthase n=1 Tax=Thiocapsa roseopersicina TaxID=1058 RepID=A0A1H2STH4_THIRO|nr:7-carboxy-7-deazaguanine synthase [Thiocapsa roseopersicina]SDW34932.1 7-carboxy-7-deazaguanine synthase, Cx14CxxC type [Thiocapsa roseopersicina]